MDILRMEELATFIESLTLCPVLDVFDYHEGAEKVMEQGFYMGTWLEKTPTCGTVGCIAGWTVEHFNLQSSLAPSFADKLNPYGKGSYLQVAKQFLGLDMDTARALFVPLLADGMSAVTPTEAAKAIRSTYETGHPNWHLGLGREV